MVHVVHFFHCFVAFFLGSGFAFEPENAYFVIKSGRPFDAFCKGLGLDLRVNSLLGGDGFLVENADDGFVIHAPGFLFCIASQLDPIVWFLPTGLPRPFSASPRSQGGGEWSGEFVGENTTSDGSTA